MSDCDCEMKIKKLLSGFKCCCAQQEQQPIVEQPIVEQPIVEQPIVEPEPIIPIKKRALLIGINYIGTSAELGGCINDVMNMKQVLIHHYDYKNEDILTITDTGRMIGNHRDGLKPTKEIILIGINNWFLKSIKEGYNQLYFHYSGHGSYLRDQNGDEADGNDECLCPLDYNTAGFIRDDELNKMFSSIPENVKLTCVIDACHSASMFDLRYELDCISVKLEENKNDPDAYLFENWSYDFHSSENKNYNNTNNILTISGCRDSQTSADAWINNKYQGALSYHLMKTLELNKYDIKIKYLLKDLHCMLENGKYSQKPVITSSKKINVDEKFSL